MPSSDLPWADPASLDATDDIDDAALARVMEEVPRGALALSGLTVALLMLAWFLVYAWVFLPRGMVG
ncbi:MAG TPA: cytochrome c oxidase subunit 2A [Beijerinckiaceae bacterium]|nr:cytochrome c oxidase subunit 2A [Beijerinckiaceae bacterium]